MGKQNFQENIKKVIEPGTDSIENNSEDLTKTLMLTSKENNKAPENVNNNFLEIVNDRGLLVSCLLSPLSKITNPEHTSQNKLLKDPQPKWANDLLIKNNTSYSI